MTQDRETFPHACRRTRLRSNSSPCSSGTGHGRGFPDEASFVFRPTASASARRRDTTVAGVADGTLQPWKRINERTTARHAVGPMPTATAEEACNLGLHTLAAMAGPEAPGWTSSDRSSHRALVRVTGWRKERRP